jgi:hypothetical protein
VRVFKTKWLARYARRERIADASLRESVERADRGLVDADLGGGIIKQRVARSGHGRSGGYRMLVAYRVGARAVLLYAFAKNERDDISRDELLTWREVSMVWLAKDERDIALALEERELEEVSDGEDNET